MQVTRLPSTTNNPAATATPAAASATSTAAAATKIGSVVKINSNMSMNERVLALEAGHHLLVDLCERLQQRVASLEEQLAAKNAQ